MRYIKGYIWENKVYCLVAFYIVTSSILHLVFGLNIGIPCLWHSIFGFKCPGCGLTLAFTELLRLNIAKAFETNPLIFIILPAGIYYVAYDFRKYVYKEKGKIEGGLMGKKE